MEASLLDGFEQVRLMPASAYHGSGAQNNNTGTQNNNYSTGNRNNGPGQQFIVNNHVSGFLPAMSERAREMHFFVLYSRNPGFTPREVVANEIDRLLADRVVGEQTRIAIYGLGGAGKTQIALNLAYSKKTVCNVYWVTGDTIESFVARYSAIAQLAQLKMQGLKPDEICLAVKTWLESEDSKDWILCVDNADELTPIYVVSLQSYLPKFKGTIVFISRDDSIGGKLVHPKFCVGLEPAMTEDEATATFKSALGGSHFDDADINQILQRLDHLPLAIVQAATYIRQCRITIDQYLDRLEKSEAKLLAVPLQEVDQTPRCYDYLESVLRLYTQS